MDSGNGQTHSPSGNAAERDTESGESSDIAKEAQCTAKNALNNTNSLLPSTVQKVIHMHNMEGIWAAIISCHLGAC